LRLDAAQRFVLVTENPTVAVLRPPARPVRVDVLVCGLVPAVQPPVWPLEAERDLYLRCDKKARVFFEAPGPAAGDVAEDGLAVLGRDAAPQRDGSRGGSSGPTDSEGLLDWSDPFGSVGGQLDFPGDTVMLAGTGNRQLCVEEEEELLMRHDLVDVSVHPRCAADVARMLGRLRPRILLISAAHHGTISLYGLGSPVTF
jgi:hypothetical protein